MIETDDNLLKSIITLRTQLAAWSKSMSSIVQGLRNKPPMLNFAYR